MGELFSYLLHLGIVRVLSVPIAMGILLWATYVISAPPPWTDDEDR